VGVSVERQICASEEIRSWVRRETGIVIGPWSDAFEWRLARIRARYGCESPEDLLHALESSAGGPLRDEVMDAATTQETSWFRDAMTFDALRAIVLSRGRPLAVWSAGCSYGQEIYSVAMVLAEANVLAGSRLLATDISVNALRRAREARYLAFEMARGLSARRREMYFHRSDSHWHLAPGIRDAVEFRRHDLRDEMPERFDLILCRHVLIYFDAATQRAVLERLARALRPGGYLALGNAESLRRLDAPFEKSSIGGAAFYCPLPSM
jgi:chemotaxis protein methyltransferase CheR